MQIKKRDKPGKTKKMKPYSVKFKPKKALRRVWVQKRKVKDS